MSDIIFSLAGSSKQATVKPVYGDIFSENVAKLKKTSQSNRQASKPSIVLQMLFRQNLIITLF